MGFFLFLIIIKKKKERQATSVVSPISSCVRAPATSSNAGISSRLYWPVAEVEKGAVTRVVRGIVLLCPQVGVVSRITDLWMDDFFEGFPVVV